MRVAAIHNEQGYRDLRRRFARHYDVAAQDPDLQVTDADLSGSRRLVLTHHVRNGVLLDKTEAERTLQYLAQLWGYRVKLSSSRARWARAEGARGPADAVVGCCPEFAPANIRDPGTANHEVV